MGIKQFNNPEAGFANKFLRAITFDSTGPNVGITSVGPLPDVAKASGGDVTYTPLTVIHKFTSSGSLVVPAPVGTLSCNCLIVGGGGGGGCDNGLSLIHI